MESKEDNSRRQGEGRHGAYLKRQEEVKSRVMENRYEAQVRVGEMVAHVGALVGT